MRCEACGKIPGAVVCEPLLVGGQVIGSVLVTRDQAIDRTQRSRVRESVIQAAPILANQRNLAVAERRAASDALTGLPNRRAADEAIKRMVAQAGRAVAPMSAVLLDLDHFKQINDLHGHDRGDKVLATIGQLVASSLRASDFAARYGGEEFLLLLPDTDSGGAFEVAEKLRRTIERAEVRQIGTLTASFGIATLPDDAVEPEQLLRKADRALYAAKARGRNRVEVAVATPGLPAVRSPGSCRSLMSPGSGSASRTPDAPRVPTRKPDPARGQLTGRERVGGVGRDPRPNLDDDLAVRGQRHRGRIAAPPASRCVHPDPPAAAGRKRARALRGSEADPRRETGPPG